MIGKMLINHNRSIAYVILYFNLEVLNIFFVGTNFTYMCMKTTHFDTYIAISFELPSLRMKWIHPSYPKHALTKTHSNISILREKKTHTHTQVYLLHIFIIVEFTETHSSPWKNILQVTLVHEHLHNFGWMWDRELQTKKERSKNENTPTHLT